MALLCSRYLLSTGQSWFLLILHFAIGPLTIDTDERILKLGDERVSLAHRPVGILLLLLAAEGRVVTRRSIRSAFWSTTSVHEAVISRHLSLIRTALRVHLPLPEPIETISKQGYRYTGLISVSRRARSTHAPH